MPIIESPLGAAQISSERPPPESSTQWPAIQATWARVAGFAAAVVGTSEAALAAARPITDSASATCANRIFFIIKASLAPRAILLRAGIGRRVAHGGGGGVGGAAAGELLQHRAHVGMRHGDAVQRRAVQLEQVAGR